MSNLDFVESIFGNAGDPYLPDNDARLDAEGWSGHTGCVILAPHLVSLKKKDLGIPNIKDANARQKREGMCWSSEDELYNDGGAFKITCGDKRGIIVTIIADNYYGYCKKEVAYANSKGNRLPIPPSVGSSLAKHCSTRNGIRPASMLRSKSI